MSRAVAFTTFAFVACGALLAFAACGKTVNDGAVFEGGVPPEGDARSTGPFPGDAPGYDAGGWDSAYYDAAHPDGGPSPVVACGDAGDAATCALPPSTCIDDHWVRTYTNASCGDAGTCDYQFYEMLCDPSPVAPDCYQGGCRIVIVR